jgi:hypothetical protein
MSLTSLTSFCSKPAASESIYRHCIPDFAANALDDLYGNLHSSLATLNFTNLSETSTYVKWMEESNSNNPASIFLFQKLGPSLRVVNEGMRLKKNEINHFCEYVFANDQQINRIPQHILSRGLIRQPNQETGCPLIREADLLPVWLYNSGRSGLGVNPVDL